LTGNGSPVGGLGCGAKCCGMVRGGSLTWRSGAAGAVTLPNSRLLRSLAHGWSRAPGSTAGAGDRTGGGGGGGSFGAFGAATPRAGAPDGGGMGFTAGGGDSAALPAEPAATPEAGACTGGALATKPTATPEAGTAGCAGGACLGSSPATTCGGGLTRPKLWHGGGGFVAHSTGSATDGAGGGGTVPFTRGASTGVRSRPSRSAPEVA
jgi:hypothetical protein